MSAILVVGNPFDGLRVIGPFDDATDANNYADQGDFDDETWYAVELEIPAQHEEESE